MSSFEKYIQSLGDLHDSRVLYFHFDARKNELTFALDDLFANFAGLPEYPGLTPAHLILTGVTTIAFGVDPLEESLKVFELEIVDEKSLMKATMRFWPGGRLTATFTDVSITSGEKIIWPNLPVNDPKPHF